MVIRTQQSTNNPNRRIHYMIVKYQRLFGSELLNPLYNNDRARPSLTIIHGSRPSSRVALSLWKQDMFMAWSFQSPGTIYWESQSICLCPTVWVEGEWAVVEHALMCCAACMTKTHCWGWEQHQCKQDNCVDMPLQSPNIICRETQTIIFLQLPWLGED